MTDDLKERLRTITSSGRDPYSMCHEAASRITDLEARLAAAEDKLYDAQSGPWPQWAASILTCLKDFGWRFDDLIDLPEELESYLRDYPDSAVTGLREQIYSLSTALAAAEAGEDALAEALARAHGWLKGPGDRLGPAIRQVEAALAAYEARRKG